MRLTYKTDCGYYTGMPNSVDVRDALQKLATLEDVEEELGIDLITLFKALEQETLFIKTETDIRETLKAGEGWGMKHFEFEDGEPIIFAQIMYSNGFTGKDWLTPLRLKLSDYGKSWALTKEELK